MKSSLVAIPSLLEIIKRKQSHFLLIGYLYKKYSPNMSSSIQNMSIRALIKCRPFTVFIDFFLLQCRKCEVLLWSHLVFVKKVSFLSLLGLNIVFEVYFTQYHLVKIICYWESKCSNSSDIDWVDRLLCRKYFSQLNCSTNINLNADTYNVHNLSLSETSPSFTM